MKGFSQQKWYAEGLRFECARCGACCTGEPGYVWVAEGEARDIADFLGVSSGEFSSRYLRTVGRYDSLVELPDRRCIFYGDDTCAIYPVRPLQCRTFPFWQSIVASPEAWRRCQEKCPGAGKGRLYSADEIERIARLSSAGLGGRGFRPR